MAEGQARYIIKVQDDGTATIERFGNAAQTAEGKVRKTGDAVNDLVTAGAGLIVFDQVFSFAKGAVSDFDKLQTSMAGMNIALANMGSNADTTVGHMKDLADLIEQHSIFGHTEVLDAEKFLLPFSAIRGKMRDEIVQVGADVSSYFGRPLQDSMAILARAFSSPERGLLMLRQSGIVFTEQQTKMLTAMANTGHMAEYQGYLMDDLRSKFAGVAQTISDTGAGAFAKLNSQFTTMKEKLGGAFEALALKFMPALESIVEFFTAHTGLIEFFIVTIASLVGWLSVYYTITTIAKVGTAALAVAMDATAGSAMAMWTAITLGGALALPAILALAGFFNGDSDISISNPQLDDVTSGINNLAGALNPIPGSVNALNETMQKMPGDLSKNMLTIDAQEKINEQAELAKENSGLYGFINNADSTIRKFFDKLYQYSPGNLLFGKDYTEKDLMLSNNYSAYKPAAGSLFSAINPFTTNAGTSAGINTNPGANINTTPDYTSEPKSTNIVTNIQNLVKEFVINNTGDIGRKMDDIKSMVAEALIEAADDANIRTQQG